jgi:hypothetical protein
MTVHSSLSIEVCDSPRDAIEKGYNYASNKSAEPISVEKVIVVRKGTQSGRSTVDFLLKTEDGKQYVFMVTSALLESIPSFWDI